jgi:hypothetical protein
VTRLLPETSRRDRPAEDWISVNRRLSLDCRLQGKSLIEIDFAPEEQDR